MTDAEHTNTTAVIKVRIEVLLSNLDDLHVLIDPARGDRRIQQAVNVLTDLKLEWRSKA